MWRFVDLTSSEKDARRRLLDQYSLTAHLLPLFPLLLLSLTYHLPRLLRFLHPSPSRPSSPHLKPPPSSPSLLSSSYVKFWLTSPAPSPLGLNLDTNALLLSTLVWSLVLLYLSVAETGEDYLHLTKRLGIVAASQLPWQYLLAWKSRFNPLALATGGDWTGLNSVHQALGRVVMVGLGAHAGLYLNFLVQVGVLGKRVRDRDVMMGLVGVGLFGVMGGGAVGWVRERSYRAFVVAHVVTGAAVLPVMWAHVSHVRVFIAEAAVVWVVGVWLRAWETREVGALVRGKGEGLVEISVARGGWKGWRPGQHLYLSLGKGGSLPTAAGRNPFSIASLERDGRVRCVVRVMDGHTKNLVKGKAKREERRTVKVEGPYGRGDHLERLLECDRVLMIAGGVGMTFILPLLRELISGQHQRRTKVEAIWAVKSMDEVDWIFDDLEDSGKDALKAHLTIFVTGLGSSPAHNAPTSTITTQDGASAQEDDTVDQDGAGVEMESLLANKSTDQVKGTPTPRSGRPNLRRLIDQTFAQSATEKTGIYVCGPAGMGTKVRTDVSAHAARGRDVLFWSEEFGLN
ncbi:hypothetical protein KVT40_002117 [Elsinoe batatas]|uniref:ferric-chelate reductase (NADPH) n=1 Tax=Elsinoe batatas TaxID=2601811 RepID=A0A8K0L9C1_9PEZI|nr:hypothetical protein KVT40_002117 [Elsinoe batatas]